MKENKKVLESILTTVSYEIVWNSNMVLSPLDFLIFKYLLRGTYALTRDMRRNISCSTILHKYTDYGDCNIDC